MPPRRKAYDEGSDYVNLSRGSMSPDIKKIRNTRIARLKTTRFLPKHRKVNSGNSFAEFLGSHSTLTTSPTATAASAFSCSECLVSDNSSAVHYSGSWILNVGPKSSTTHSTTVSGSTISLRFNGSGIVVFGTVPATLQPPTVVYLLDQEPFPTTLPVAEKDVPNQPLFTSPHSLSNDEHTLVINVTDASAPYILDKFFIFPNGDNPQDKIGQVPTGGIESTTIFSSDVTSPTPQAAPAASSSLYSKDASQNSARTLAAVLPTLVLLVLTGTVVFFIFRRRIVAKRRLAMGIVGVNARPATMYTSWTTPESILRHESDFWSSHFHSPRSQDLRSEGRSSGPQSFSDPKPTIDFAPPPLFPKVALLSSHSKPG